MRFSGSRAALRALAMVAVAASVSLAAEAGPAPLPSVANPRVATALERIIAANDAAGSDFLVIDKIAAELYVFRGDGHLRSKAPVLLGSARGDRTVPGIGERPLKDVRPEERTTPAGRFLGEKGHNARGEDVVWVDYDAAVSIHRVLTTNAAERRQERLRTPTALDNRISYGCINVGRDFYESYVRPMFATSPAPVYVLPEVDPLDAVLPAANASF